MPVALTSGRSDGSVATISRCSDFRRSTIEKKPCTRGLRPTKVSTKPTSWSYVRTASTVGMIGTSTTSAACNTFSDTSDRLGGVSRKTRSYSPDNSANSRCSTLVGFFADCARSMSMLR